MPPDLEKDEEAFPCSPIEEHMGTVEGTDPAQGRKGAGSQACLQFAEVKGCKARVSVSTLGCGTTRRVESNVLCFTEVVTI